MERHEIWYARVTWNDCPDERPWLIMEQRGETFCCFPVSGQCYRREECFFLDVDHPDFKATGLTKSCYIHFVSLFELPHDVFSRRKGRLEGKLLQRFLEEAGFSSESP
ncbi:MAG: hypothetical protein HY719_15935 [Planctomycetes bacterium]|nr:hypothetical protein [Planctomycetota bacterium]